MKTNTVITNLWRHLIVAGVLTLSLYINAYAAGETILIPLDGLMGARPAGMGETFIGLSDDINALHSNPAGLSFLVQPEVSTMYLTGLTDSHYGFVGVVYPFKKSTIGLSMAIFDGGKMNVNMLNSNGSFKESKSLSAQKDSIAMFSYSFAVGSALSMGWNLKAISSILAEDYNAAAYAVDMGILIRPVNDRLCLGLAAKNIVGNPIKYKNVEHPLPVTVKVGCALRQNDWLTLCADYEKPGTGLKSGFKLGGEFLIKKLIALRAGYKIGYDQSTFNLGFGINTRGFLIDYSFAGMKDLDSMQQVSFTTNFGGLSNYRKAEGYHKKGMYERAIYWASKIKESDENFEQTKEIIADSRKQVTAYAYYAKGERFFMNRNYEVAVECWQKVVETIPKYHNTEALLDNAKVCLAMEEARIAMSKAQKIVNEAASMGLDMEKAKNILNDSKGLYERTDYSLAKSRAEESSQIASNELGKKKEEIVVVQPVQKPKLAVQQPKLAVQQPKLATNKRMNIAVSDLEAHEVSAMEASTIADFLRTELINSQVFVVLERSNMSKILAEQKFQQTGCTTNECAVQMGKILNVESILIGSFSKILNAYHITVRLVNVETGAAILAETVRFTNTEELSAKITELVNKIAKRVAEQ
ncbi:MAG: PorV/PorQ family protein [Candidatus Desantisbacteria bacterium]